MENDITELLKRRTYLFFTIFLFVVTCLSFFLLHGMRQSDQFIISNARLVYEQSILQAANPMIVQEIHTEEGASIVRGALLVTVQNVCSDEELAHLKKNVELAQKNIEQIQYGTVAAQSIPVPTEALESARVRMERMNELYEMGAVSAAKRNEAATAYEQEKAAFGSIQAVRRADPKAVQTAEEQLKKAELALEKARNTGITVLYAQRDGSISKVSVKAGDILAAGDELMTINIREHPWIEAEISEEDAHRVYLGQIVRYKFSDIWTEGTVEEITEAAAEDGEDEKQSEKIVRISVSQEHTPTEEDPSNITLYFAP